MNYPVVFEEQERVRWYSHFDEIFISAMQQGPTMIYELHLTRRKRPRLVLTDRKTIVEKAIAFYGGRRGIEKLTNVRNPFRGKPGLPPGSQHITKDETGELVIRPYQEA